MRQPVVEDGVLGIAPLAENDIAGAESRMEPMPVRLRPGLEEGELGLPTTAPERVPPRLQLQRSIGAEAQCGIGVVDLLREDESTSRRSPRSAWSSSSSPGCSREPIRCGVRGYFRNSVMGRPNAFGPHCVRLTANSGEGSRASRWFRHCRAGPGMIICAPWGSPIGPCGRANEHGKGGGSR